MSKHLNNPHVLMGSRHGQSLLGRYQKRGRATSLGQSMSRGKQATACVWSMRNSETSSHNPRKLLADSLLGVTQRLKPPLEQKETEPMGETEAKAGPR